MATSGSFNTTVYGGYNRYLTFSWSIKVQTPESNYTVINWELKGAGGSSTTNYYYSAPFKLVVNGVTVYESSTRIQLKNGTVLATGESVISHNADGKKTFSASAEAAIYSYEINSTGSGSWELPQIPRQATLTTAPNFNDEENPTITYSNLAGNSVTTLQACISLTGADADIAYRDIPKTGTSYTFNLTTAERNTLINATKTSNSRTVSFFIKTVIGSNTYYSSLNKTLTIVNATPTLNPVAVDTNTTIINLTGNSSTLVKYYSNAKVTSGVSLKKSATLKSIKITNGSKSITTDGGTINAVESGTFTVTVTDSRGNTATQSINNNFSNYIYPSVNMSGSNITTDGKTTLKFSGNFYNSYLGGTKNTISLSYCISVNGGSYGSWVTVTPTLDSHKYTANVNLTGLNYQNTYKFKGRIVDKLNTKTTEIEVVSKPVFEWGKDDFKVNARKVSGNIYGLGKLEGIPNNSNFNNYLTPGVYGVYSHANAATMTNIPVPSAGKLVVYSSLGTEWDQSYAYITQEYYPLDVDNPIYRRMIHTSGTANQWTYGNWVRDRGTVTLWSGNAVMDEGHTAYLSEKISSQPNGVVFRFSSSGGDYNFNEIFVTKDFVQKYSGEGHSFPVFGGGMASAGCKYLYIYDDKVVGMSANVLNATLCSIDFNNSNFHLREIIGV